MFRHPVEIEAHVRHQVAALTPDHLVMRLAEAADHPRARLARLRRTTGLALIRLGERLAGRGTIPNGTPTMHLPATAGRSGS